MSADCDPGGPPELANRLSGTQASRLTRVTPLTGLAIRLDGLIWSGELSDQATVARLGLVSRIRVTQIMNLLCLAPYIQEQLLFLPPVDDGRSPFLIRDTQLFAREPDWAKRRQM